MPDGVRLSARIWWPQESTPCPAILEYIPYRKRDMVRSRDERNHPYFTQYGYVCLRVDMRGSGDSEGQMHDMYTEDEQSDTRYLINWIAIQNWCNGRVGMFGTSWGGTASLQAAVDAPAPLKAVIANCATIDRFEDDIHWMGGTLLSDSFEWGTTLPVILSSPPDVSTVGKQWQQQWHDRLNNLAFPLNQWIMNNIRGDYWRNGSIAFDTKNLSCPVLSIGGWSDRYSNSVMKLSELRPDICWGIVGPWGHHYPDQGEPGPAIGFQQLALKWWNHWLRDQNDEITKWPVLRLWKREFDPPTDRLLIRNGIWIEARDCKPIKNKILYLKPDCLTNVQSGNSISLTIPNDLSHGECSGDTGYFGKVGGLPLDQSADDQRSLTFESEPLDENLDLIGYAELFCDILRDQNEAQIACRICEITPDGYSNLVTRHVLNLTLDETLDKPREFAPNHPIHYRIKLPSTAYTFCQGNRIRLSLGTSYWPITWPTTKSVSINIKLSTAKLIFPSIQYQSSLSVPFSQLKKFPKIPSWQNKFEGQLRRTTAQLSDGILESSWYQPTMTIFFAEIDVGISITTSAYFHADITESRTFTCQFTHNIEISRSDGTARVDHSLMAQSSESGMEIQSTLSAHWNCDRITTRTWQFQYPPPTFDEEFSE